MIIYTEQDFETETRRLTEGQGVHVVYDGVGKDTFAKDLKVLRPRGYLVLFGGASGAVPPFDLLELTKHGSLFVTRPSLQHYIATREELEATSGRCIANGSCEVNSNCAYTKLIHSPKPQPLTAIWKEEKHREVVIDSVNQG